MVRLISLASIMQESSQESVSCSSLRTRCLNLGTSLRGYSPANNTGHVYSYRQDRKEAALT